MNEQIEASYMKSKFIIEKVYPPRSVEDLATIKYFVPYDHFLKWATENLQ